MIVFGRRPEFAVEHSDGLDASQSELFGLLLFLIHSIVVFLICVFFLVQRMIEWPELVGIEIKKKRKKTQNREKVRKKKEKLRSGNSLQQNAEKKK